MHCKRVLLASILWATSFCLAQTDLVYPWVTNQPQFRGRIVINNLNAEAATVTLTARRQEGQSPNEQTVVVNMDPLEQIAVDAGLLFDQLGDGGGFSVRLTSESANIQGGFVVFGTNSPSGSSPSQANVIPAANAANILLFNYLPVAESVISAPVLVNPGAETAQVRFHAYSERLGKIGTFDTAVSAGFPLASLTSSLFPDAAGADVYLVVESLNQQPLLGVAFIFNSPELEPSMANAIPIPFVPEGPMVEPISFANQIQPIFNQSCGNGLCHLDGNSANGLALDPGVAYDNIVGVPNTQNPDFNRVEPFEPLNSWLYLKLLDNPPFGQRMPRGRDPLPANEIELIRLWIEQGAQDN